ncbi:MAG: EAL domain-containing protein, partial [Arenimonas sp.]
MLPDLFQFSWHAAAYLPAALLIAATGVFMCVRERANRISRDFLAFTAFFAAWMVLAGARMLMTDADTATVAARFGRAAVSLGIPPLLQFSFTVLHTWGENRALMRITCGVGTLLALASVGTPWIVQGVAQMPWGFKPQQGLLAPMFTVWAAVMLGWLAIGAARACSRTRPDGFQRQQTRRFCGALIVLFTGAASLLSYVGGALHAFGTACIVAFALVAAYITARHGVANVTARFASPAFADVMRVGMVILDHDGVIQFANEPAARKLGIRRHELIGHDLAALLGHSMTPSQFAAMAAAPADGGTEVAYRPAGSQVARYLSLSVSAMTDRQGAPTAFVCLLRDVTEEHHARQRDVAAQAPQPSSEELELRRAVANREFAVHYQPIVELKRGTVTGFEALVRWIHPHRGTLGPADFLPAAEACGLLGVIDRMVLEQACADLPCLRAETGQPALFVSVNQSTAALSSPDLVHAAGELVARNGLTPKDVRLELLESTVVIDSVRETLRALRSAGFGICIDDFGTGHSALSRLHEAPVTTLKIDR